jgi:hypothetical protein
VNRNPTSGLGITARASVPLHNVCVNTGLCRQILSFTPRFGPEWVMDTEAFAASHEGTQLMLRNLPFLSRLFSKLLHELLPAAIASVVGGMLFSYYAHPSVTTPPTAIGAPASVEAMQMMRDEHALIVNYLQKYTEARKQSDFTAEQEILTSKAAEQAAKLAASEARAAETRALAIAALVAAKPERKVAEKRPAQELDTAAVGKPLQLLHTASIATQIQPVVQPTIPRTRLVTPAAGSDENVIKTKLREVTATVERIPLWFRSVAEWFAIDVPSHRVLQLRNGIS